MKIALALLGFAAALPVLAADDLTAGQMAAADAGSH